MLDFLRKRKRNWIIILFLGAIIVSFALFVGSGNFGDPRGANVATINDEPITQREFATLVGTSPSRLSTYVTGNVTPSAAMLLRINRMAKRARNDAARAGGSDRSGGPA